jgi:hypothetical protein
MIQDINDYHEFTFGAGGIALGNGVANIAWTPVVLGPDQIQTS